MREKLVPAAGSQVYLMRLLLEVRIKLEIRINFWLTRQYVV